MGHLYLGMGFCASPTPHPHPHSNNQNILLTQVVREGADLMLEMGLGGGGGW